eukprot:11130035-Ditylum_brightwellii.AAC.1
MQSDWLNIVLAGNKTIDTYTTRVQDAAQEFDETTINLAAEDIGKKWRLGLGHGFEDFNKMCHLNQ